jgi:hypothetical protein
MLQTSLIDRFTNESPLVKAAFLAAVASLLASAFTLFTTVISGPIKYWFDNMALTAKLNIEYRYKNLAELQNLTRRYKGLLLAGAESLNTRFWNLYKNESNLWMDVNGDYLVPRYYFRSWVQRLARVVATATAFENEALYIDQAIATETDFQFIYMLKSWTYVLSNVALFEGTDYDKSRQYDHLFQDTVRSIGEAAWVDGHFASDDQFEVLMSSHRDVRSLCALLDGIKSSEKRLRWDRLVCFHILLLIFLNTFGYPVHKSSEEQFEKVIGKIGNRQIMQNLKDVLTLWHLRKSEAGQLAYRLLEKHAACA